MQYFIAIAFFLISACTTTEAIRGAELRQSKIDEIKPESTRDEVMKLLGSPSTKSTYGEEVWYYINNVRRKNIVSEDEVVSQEVLAITFTPESTVKNVEVYDLNSGKEIQFSEDRTATAGHSLTILEQLLGNIGKFNTQSMADKVGQSGGGTAGRGR